MPKAAPKAAPLDTQRCLELVFEPLKAVEEVVQVPATDFTRYFEKLDVFPS